MTTFKYALFAIFLGFFGAFARLEAQEPPKQCIDLRTMTIILVPAGMPCPYPTTEA